MTQDRKFTPALGVSWLTPAYDVAIRFLTREKVWRRRLLGIIALQPGEKLLDIGCGTGSLAIALASQQPTASIHAVDPDPKVLARAGTKAKQAGVSVHWHEGFFSEEFIRDHGPFEVVTCSLVLHQVRLDEKRRMLYAMNDALAERGRLVIADYGWQRSLTMRLAFRLTVQAIDGVRDTQPNADNILPQLFSSTGFDDVREKAVIATPTGSISIYASA